MAPFDPHTQSVTFLAPDGHTPITIPIPAIDAANTYSFNVCISYGAQIGASLIMLLVVLIMTPTANLRRPSHVLHVATLLLSFLRMVLLAVFFPSPFNEFYNFFANDFTSVPQRYFATSVASCVFSMLLLILVEIELMNQAWTMVRLWPRTARFALCGLSLVITLMTMGWRIAGTVLQINSIVYWHPSPDYFWITRWTIITNAVSICWFCAVFNLKLVIHLVKNRGILPSYKTMTPMEVLVMTNGLLMIVPVIFSGLEWTTGNSFEAASLALTSVAIILPLGTIAAQRVAISNAGTNPTLGLYSSSSRTPYSSTTSQTSQPGHLHRKFHTEPMTTTPVWPYKTVSASVTETSSTNSSAGSYRKPAFVPTVTSSVMSRCEGGVGHGRRPDLADLQLAQIDNECGSDSDCLGSSRGAVPGHVRVDRDFEQHFDRV